MPAGVLLQCKDRFNQSMLGQNLYSGINHWSSKQTMGQLMFFYTAYGQVLPYDSWSDSVQWYSPLNRWPDSTSWCSSSWPYSVQWYEPQNSWHIVPVRTNNRTADQSLPLSSHHSAPGHTTPVSYHHWAPGHDWTSSYSQLSSWPD